MPSPFANAKQVDDSHSYKEPSSKLHPTKEKADAKINTLQGTKRCRSHPQETQKSDSVLPPPSRKRYLHPAVSDKNDLSSNASFVTSRDIPFRPHHDSMFSLPPSQRPTSFSFSSPRPTSSHSKAPSGSDQRLASEQQKEVVSTFESSSFPVVSFSRQPSARLSNQRSNVPIRKSKKDDAKIGDNPLPQLLSELNKLRKESSLVHEKQQAILDELRRMGTEDRILEPMFAVIGIRNEADHGINVDPEGMLFVLLKAPGLNQLSSAAKTRLRAIEQEITIERKRRNKAMDELRTIEREGRDPFVVPALLHAFISLSKLTTDTNSKLKNDYVQAK
ncbi:uncharacterized protein C8R40DRAFT_1170721 [Lentinula edodes]|uniref:uncharacterized protein n=1 Tax=Lentinula edodes TaxID=5353 RepID=UPI001E8CBB3F|nr:uncharacterized protein C8R40DRAFT_1170721 [Lentinula edodes]KAH7875091.1 hypothetical protein C8R40DRAFT_1170721 [Lentinula edodes]